MLIFDKFPSRSDAEAFAKSIRLLDTRVCDSWEEAFELDKFPFDLVPPIVLVERPLTEEQEIDFGKEPYYIRKAKQFGGEFAGT